MTNASWYRFDEYMAPVTFPFCLANIWHVTWRLICEWTFFCLTISGEKRIKIWTSNARKKGFAGMFKVSSVTAHETAAFSVRLFASSTNCATAKMSRRTIFSSYLVNDDSYPTQHGLVPSKTRTWKAIKWVLKKVKSFLVVFHLPHKTTTTNLHSGSSHNQIANWICFLLQECLAWHSVGYPPIRLCKFPHTKHFFEKGPANGHASDLVGILSGAIFSDVGILLLANDSGELTRIRGKKSRINGLEIMDSGD